VKKKRTNGRKPYDPVEAERARELRAQQAKNDAAAREINPARWGEDRASKDRLEALERHGAEVRTDSAGRITYAQKLDVWEQMFKRNNLTQAQHAAVRELQADMIRAAGFGMGEGDEYVVVDRQGDAAGAVDYMLEARSRVEDALQLVGPPSSRILSALLDPEAPAEDWRAIVTRVSGETNAMSQGTVLRQAAQALADVQGEIDRREKARFNLRKDRLDAAGNEHMRASAA